MDTSEFLSINKSDYTWIRKGLTFLVFWFIFQNTDAQEKKNNRVLIVDGFSNHDWQQTSVVTKWILEESNLFDVDVSTVPIDSASRQGWLPNFEAYAVVIQNTNNIHNPQVKWPNKAEKALERYVAKGGGLYILHSANNAFSHWDAYEEMIGLGWRSKDLGTSLEVDPEENIIRHKPGEGQGTGHGDRFNALIQRLNDHPIHDGYPKAWQTVNTEVYYFPRGAAKNLVVLSYAYDSTSTKKMWPVEWVVTYGKGKVYNSTLGHLWEGEAYPPAYRCVGYQTTVIRVTEWLATNQVTFPVPPDFPTDKIPSLKPEEGFLHRNPTSEQNVKHSIKL